MNPWTVVPMLIVIAILFVVAPVGGAAFAQFRRRKIVQCPVTKGDAVIRLDPMQSALAELIRNGRFAVADCSLWPDRHSCSQSCLRLAPALVRDAPRAS
jgi:hypothetical protein